MTNMSLYDNDSIPWKEGCWRMGEIRGIILETSGKKQLKWKNLVLECQFGKFGRASKEITVATGSEEYTPRVYNPEDRIANRSGFSEKFRSLRQLTL